MKKSRRSSEPYRQLRKQLVELFVARQDPQKKISGIVEKTRNESSEARIYAAGVLRTTKCRFSKTFTSRTPVRNPPTCAHTATPPVRSAPFFSSGSAATSCQKNHQMRTIHAGIGMILKKMMKKKSILTRTFG